MLFLGTGSPLSVLYNTSILVNKSILFDSPPGIDKKIIENNKSIKNVDYIFISHLHGDNYLGLPQLLLGISYSKRTKKLYVIGPKGTEKTTFKILGLTSKGEERDIIKKSNVIFIELFKNNEEMKINDLSFEYYQLEHGIYINYGYILNLENNAVSYTGDTGPCINLNQLIQKSNTIIIDMTFKEATNNHLGIDFIKKISNNSINKTFYAVHRGNKIDSLSLKIKGVKIPKDGDKYKI